jgi:hypothetical protein
MQGEEPSSNARYNITLNFDVLESEEPVTLNMKGQKGKNRTATCEIQFITLQVEHSKMIK